MDENLSLLILVLLIEMVISFGVMLGSCLMMEKVFGYSLRYCGPLFLLPASLAEPAWLAFEALGMGVTMFELNYYMYVTLFTVLIWVFASHRRWKEIPVVLGAVVFSANTCFGISTAFQTLILDLSGISPHSLWVLPVLFLANLISMGCIILIAVAGRKRTEEKLSWVNILLLDGIALIFGMRFEDGGLVMNYEGVDLSMFLTFAGVLTAVIVSVRVSENRHYTRLLKMNEACLSANESYYESVRKSNFEIRRMQHDMKNHLMCMSELCSGGRYEELSEYLTSLRETLSSASLAPETGNAIADAIISDKRSRAKEEKAVLEVSGSFEGAQIAPVDLCAILANLLDNALEAAVALPEEQRHIKAEFRSSPHFWLITVSNYTDHAVDTETTEKEDKLRHGFGIYNVRQAAKKYGGAVEFSSRPAEEDEHPAFLFSAEVMLPKSA